MKYAVCISPDDSVEIKEYKDYHTINDLVDGWYETCGVFGVGDKLTILFCNEEFLFHDDLQFNAIGTALANQPIYGNIVLLQNGYNEDNERDALPFEKAEAESICNAMYDFRIRFDAMLEALHLHYDNNKPVPSAEIITMSADTFEELFEVNDENL